jgi:hypothetical protein
MPKAENVRTTGFFRETALPLQSKTAEQKLIYIG